MESLLRIDDLSIAFHNQTDNIQILHGVGLKLGKGEILGLVGESGSGKSLTCLAMMRLLPQNAEIGGRLMFKNKELGLVKDAEMSRIRGREIAMIFQDPIGALNPVQTVGKQLMEAIRINSDKHMSKPQIRKRAVELMKETGIPDPEERLKKYPHELSGGQNQRVMIAMMLSGNPDLLIADEPTTALDVTIQAQILKLLKRLRDERNMAVILVTHDLGVVAETCDRMAVMYCGRIVETGTVKSVFSDPTHPYTRGLLKSRPRSDKKTNTLTPIKGVVPMPADLPKGCAFEPRCPNRGVRCAEGIPESSSKIDGGMFACFNPVARPYKEEEEC